jgi:pimeloyl-ACP methyl ester carboxylesterase
MPTAWRSPEAEVIDREGHPMTTATASRVRHVTSADGTRIGVFVSGRGRPLVLVPGTTSDHTTWRAVTPLFEDEVSVYAVDRRGRGESGDTPPYTIDKEYADVAAVVDAAAESFGGPVDLLGHSYGGNVAYGASMLTSSVRRLVLYEGWPPPEPSLREVPDDILSRLEALLAEGAPGAMLETFYREVVLMSEGEVEEIRSAPSWPARLSVAPTVPREIRAFSTCAFDAEAAAQVTVPVLLLVGSETPEWVRARPEVIADALPNARIELLPGQAHMAHLTDPPRLKNAVQRFLTE